ncbi:hypothetical protein L1S35_04990 [Flavobacterium sp. AS60]|uniref:hypothetical protein n=1 Tax=Flavobacterium anseongense TaxID=2910677 RepID=UPI001F30CB39|nr:hypothetical protein [Flavobacterium sp. AS60]MCF6129019.1 hypothetical protein [Flavobacterium sp. AS60]
MNKIKIIAGLFLLVISFTFTACEVEPIDSSIVLDDGSTDGGGGTGGGGTGGGGGGTSTGDYWPTALNNQWVFKNNGVVQEPMKMISINSIGGNTYYTFDQLFGASSGGTSAGVVARLRKNSGDYYLKIEDFTFDTGLGITGNLTGYQMLLLKDYLNAGQTWSGSFTQTATFTGLPSTTQATSYTGQILERDATVTVNGVSYTNVIKSKITQVVTVMGAPANNVVTEYWFSKNIGPIKSVTVSTDDVGSETTTSELESYILN